MEKEPTKELIIECPACKEENVLDLEQLDGIDSVFCGECGVSVPVVPMDFLTHCPKCASPRKRKHGTEKYPKFCFRCRFSFEEWKTNLPPETTSTSHPEKHEKHTPDQQQIDQHDKEEHLSRGDYASLQEYIIVQIVEDPNMDGSVVGCGDNGAAVASLKLSRAVAPPFSNKMAGNTVADIDHGNQMKSAAAHSSEARSVEEEALRSPKQPSELSELLSGGDGKTNSEGCLNNTEESTCIEKIPSDVFKLPASTEVADAQTDRPDSRADSVNSVDSVEVQPSRKKRMRKSVFGIAEEDFSGIREKFVQLKELTKHLVLLEQKKPNAQVHLSLSKISEDVENREGNYKTAFKCKSQGKKRDKLMLEAHQAMAKFLSSESELLFLKDQFNQSSNTTDETSEEAETSENLDGGLCADAVSAIAQTHDEPMDTDHVKSASLLQDSADGADVIESDSLCDASAPAGANELKVANVSSHVDETTTPVETPHSAKYAEGAGGATDPDCEADRTILSDQKTERTTADHHPATEASATEQKAKNSSTVLTTNRAVFTPGETAIGSPTDRKEITNHSIDDKTAHGSVCDQSNKGPTTDHGEEPNTEASSLESSL